MQSKILNLPDALKIASIVYKYFPKSIEGLTVEEFALNLFSGISSEDGVVLLSILLGTKPQVNPSDVIRLCVDTLMENKIVVLMETYKTIGFR